MFFDFDQTQARAFLSLGKLPTCRLRDEAVPQTGR